MVRYSVAMSDGPNAHGEAEAVCEIDTRGMICPLPVLRVRKTLATLRPGDLLRVSCTDPAAATDFPAFCQAAGHKLLESRRQDAGTGRDWGHATELVFLIRRGG